MAMPGAYQPAGIIVSLHEAMDAACEAHKNGEFASGSDAPMRPARVSRSPRGKA